MAQAYGFSSDDDVLTQLLALNQSIAEEEGAGHTEPRRPGNAGFPNTKRTAACIQSDLQLQ